MKNKGIKNDQKKNRWDCLPLPLFEGIAKVMTYGAKKYNENPDDPNWLKVKGGKNRYYAAMMRHLCSYQKGELIDTESNLKHIDHFMFNAMAFSYFVNSGDIDG